MLKQIKNFIFKDYSTDIALRYLPVVDLIKKEKLENSKILEVGSGDLGITTYFEKPIIGVDIKFEKQNSGFLNKIIFNGKRLPFNNNEFDLTISVDCLEHIKKTKREKLIFEILRVTKKFIILVIPCGEKSYLQDKKLDNYFFKTNNYRDKFLVEHIQNGLPSNEEIAGIFKTHSSILNKKIEIYPTQKLLNLRLRKIIMKCKISHNPLLNVIYYLFLLLVPIRKYLNVGDCYRLLFFIEIKN